MNPAEIIEKGALAIYFQSPTPWASSWPSYVDEEVRKICRRQYRAAYLATLDAIRKPSQTVMRSAQRENLWAGEAAFAAVIDALKREVAG